MIAQACLVIAWIAAIAVGVLGIAIVCDIMTDDRACALLGHSRRRGAFSYDLDVLPPEAGFTLCRDDERVVFAPQIRRYVKITPVRFSCRRCGS